MDGWSSSTRPELISLTSVYVLRALAFDAANRLGLIAGQRLFLVGGEADVREFTQRYNLRTLGCQIVGIGYLSPAGDPLPQASQRFNESVDNAVAKARALAPDNIMLIAPWSNQATIDRCIDAFMTLPCSISLAPERILERFDHITIEKLGPIASLHLLHPPMSAISTSIKRIFDILSGDRICSDYCRCFSLSRSWSSSTARDRSCSGSNATDSIRSRS